MIEIKFLNNLKFNKPILIEGLPGMGNVGKIAIDFMIEIFEIYSDRFPSLVFVDEKNIINMCKINIYYKKIKGKEYFFVSGDIQPVDEIGIYEFCDGMLNLFKNCGGKELITLGGIGVENISSKANVYYASTNLRYNFAAIKKYSGHYMGPILGVTGILLGLAKKKELKGVCLLAETNPNPGYIGVHGARELLKVLNDKYDFGLRINVLDKEIKEIEKEITKKVEKIANATREMEYKKVSDSISYIG